jgi:hypothetical protein
MVYNPLKNYKNILQEYYQKKKLPLPQYDTTRVGGSDTSPKWQSIVNCDNIAYLGDICQEKTAAENSAAFLAFKAINSIEKTTATPTDFNVSTAILIDIENLPKFFEEIPDCDLNNENLTVYGFIGQYHPLSTKYEDKKMIKILSPSTRQDGTDTCIQVYTGILLALEKYEHYIIATKDHFGSSLVEMINSHSLGWVVKTAKLVISYKNI